MSDLEAKLDLARARMDARSFVEYEAKLLRAEVERVRSDAAAVGETYKLMIEERGEQMARIEALEAEVASQRAEGDYLRGIIDELRVEHAKALARIPDPDDLRRLLMRAVGDINADARELDRIGEDRYTFQVGSVDELRASQAAAARLRHAIESMEVDRGK